MSSPGENVYTLINQTVTPNSHKPNNVDTQILQNDDILFIFKKERKKKKSKVSSRMYSTVTFSR